MIYIWLIIFMHPQQFFITWCTLEKHTSIRISHMGYEIFVHAWWYRYCRKKQAKLSTVWCMHVRILAILDIDLCTSDASMCTVKYPRTTKWSVIFVHARTMHASAVAVVVLLINIISVERNRAAWDLYLPSCHLYCGLFLFIPLKINQQY